jgi:hypothetical protein
MSLVRLKWAFTAGRRRQRLRWAGIVRVDGFAALKAAAGRGSAGLAVPTDIRAGRFMVLMDPTAEPPIGAPIRRPAGDQAIITTKRCRSRGYSRTTTSAAVNQRSFHYRTNCHNIVCNKVLPRLPLTNSLARRSTLEGRALIWSPLIAVGPRWPSARLPTAGRRANGLPSPRRRSCGFRGPGPWPDRASPDRSRHK